MRFRLILPALLIGILTTGLAARAAEPVFPGISRIGITPPAGMKPAAHFTGFEQAKGDGVMLFNELPKEAYDELSKSLTDQALTSQGVQIISRGKLDGLKADNIFIVTEQKIPNASLRRYLLVAKGDDLTGLITVQLPREAQKALPDSDIRKSLASYAVRAPLSAQQQMAGLPFTIGDLAGFRLIKTFSGNAAMLTEGPADVIKSVEQPTVVVAAAYTAIPEAARVDFGRRALSSLPQLQEVRIDSDDMKGTGDNQASELVGSARSGATGDLTIVFQSIHFTKDGYLRLVGQGKLENRDTLLAQFRKMAASLQSK